MIGSKGRACGYPIESCHESDQAKLSSDAASFPYRAGRDFEAPAEMDPSTWHVIENQGSQGSCQGHALSSVVEGCYRIAMRGEVEQFSRHMAYVGGQQFDGIRGDRGGTLSGGMELVTTKGLCLESTAPYPSRYTPYIPAEAWAEAEKYKIRSKVWLENYDQLFNYLSSGAGKAEIGLKWTPECSRSTGTIEEYTGLGRAGGHAVAILGYSRRVDSKGRKYIWLDNSHGKQWANGGRAEVSPAAIDGMLAHPWTSCMGLSDLSVDHLQPRPVSFHSGSFFDDGTDLFFRPAREAWFSATGLLALHWGRACRVGSRLPGPGWRDWLRRSERP